MTKLSRKYEGITDNSHRKGNSGDEIGDCTRGSSRTNIWV